MQNMKLCGAFSVLLNVLTTVSLDLYLHQLLFFYLHHLSSQRLRAQLTVGLEK